jgi:sec-independent protein translocase protein TatA
MAYERLQRSAKIVDPMPPALDRSSKIPDKPYPASRRLDIITINVQHLRKEDKIMFDTIGLPELLIILTIVALLFGVGRISKVGKELGSAISSFRQGLNEGAREETAIEANQASLDPSLDAPKIP